MNIEQQQASLRTYNDAYRDQGCGDPPASAVELADRPLPAPAPSSSGSDTAKTVAIVGGSAVGAYLIYRGIRMIPSIVIPPLWPTIPVNAAVP